MVDVLLRRMNSHLVYEPGFHRGKPVDRATRLRPNLAPAGGYAVGLPELLSFYRFPPISGRIVSFVWGLSILTANMEGIMMSPCGQR